MFHPRVVASVLMVVVGVLVHSPADGQFRKGIARLTTEVTLNRKRAPKVYLMGTAIRVDATAQNQALAEAAKQVAVMLEAELVGHDPRLTTVKENPETTIAVSLVQVDSSRTSETREELVSRQTGTRNGKAVYSTVKEYRNYIVISGRVSATFRVQDAKTNAVLDADTLSPVYKRDFLNGVGAPEPSAVQLDLLRLVANLIVPRITPTVEPVKVLLARPNDEIDEINELGQKNLWSLMLERLTLTKPLSDKKKEAYRLYNLGVANEALAYAAGDLATSKRLLEESSSYYSRAIEGNDDEKYFREPQTRIGEAIAGYTTLQEMTVKYEEMRTAAVAAAEARSRAVTNNSRSLTTDAAASAALTNANVIKLIGSGLSDENAIAMIKGADAVAFDLGPAGLGDLLANKVTNQVISAMRARQAAKPVASPRTSSPARPAARPGPATTAPRPAAPRAPAAPAKPPAK